jgi:GDPmannose 4,6-dehydratase
MYRMLQQDQPDDYVIATGTTSKLEDFVATAFQAVGLDWQPYVISDRAFYRPTDIAIGRANPSKAERQLGWRAQVPLQDIVEKMVAACQAQP